MDSDAIENELANLAASLPGDGQLSLPDENILEQAINMDQQAGYADMVEPTIDPIGLALAESENVTDLDLSSGIPGFPEISSAAPTIQDSKVVAESLRQILLEQSNIDLPVEQIEGLLPSLAQLLPGICQSVAASAITTAPSTIPPPAPPTATPTPTPAAVPIAKVDQGKSSSNVFVRVLPNPGNNSVTQVHKPSVANNTSAYSSFSSISITNPPPSLVHAVPIAPHPSRLSNTSSSFSSDLNHHPRPSVRRIAPAVTSSGMLSASHIGKINVKVVDTPMSSSRLSSIHSYSKPHNILQPMEISEQHLPNSSTLKNLVDEVMVGDNESEYIDVGGPTTRRGFPLPSYLKDHSYAFYNPVEAQRSTIARIIPKSYSLIPNDKLSYAPVLPPTSMMLYKLLKVVPKKNLVATPISTKSVKLKIEDYQPGMKYSAKRTSTGRKSNRTWKYEEGYMSSDESTTDPEDVDLDEIDASSAAADAASARRSQRNVGRRKQYVDDINVNLSDYEEKGDSEDEQMKARKKRKYEPRPNQDSDGEESSMNTRAGPYSARNVFINPTEGFKYSDLYMDAPVEEANVVEKILSHRIRPTTEAEQHLGETIEEFFVKYKNYSYLHTEWATFSKLQAGDKRFESKMKRYKAKQEQLGVFANIDDEPFNPEYTVADRVIDVANSTEPNGEVVTHYLVKWKALPYEDSTWELEEDVDRKKVEQFKKLSTMPPWSELDFVSRPPPADFKKMKEPLVYKNNNRLRPYQLEGLNWLLFCWYTRQNCILADEMGLGKTIQAISLLISVQDAGIRGPFLIIVPLSTIANWEREFESWSEMNVVIYHGSAYSRKMIHEYELFYRDAKGRIIPGAYKFNALVTTYEVILADNSELNNVQWRVVIIDEAHRLKNKNCKLLEGLKMLNMEFRVLLTGTPLQNNVEELFSLLNFLEPAKFPILSSFMEKFGDLKTEEQVEQLKEILRPMMLRRLKDDVEKGLAPKEETIIEVELTAVQKQYYRAILEHNFSFLSKSSHSHGTAVTPSLLNTMMELRKCCNHPFLIKGAELKIVSEFKETGQVNPIFNALVQASGKMVLIDKLLTKLKESGHKVLIFSQMVRCLDILEDYLRVKGYLYERIDGGVRGTLRQAAIDRFSKPDSDRFVFLLCTRAGGLGINLTAADTVIIYDSDWNPQNDIQAQARCHRIGQERAVKVYRLITRNSYEREMFDRASMKLGLDRAVLQSMNSQNKDTSMAAQLSKKEIEDLLKKGAYGAVMEGDDDANQFCEEDIDQILERRTKVILIESAGKGSTFSKASFATEGAEDIDLDDPDFWQKWAQKAKLDLNKLANKDNLVMETPRQRKQTRRYGSEHASNIFSLDNDEEPEMAELVPSRGKKGWTKIELFKTERYLLTYGWGQWSRILNALRMKRNRLSERDIENISRTILVYCLSHYKGDEKVKPHIHRLIDPHSPSEISGSMGKSSRYGFSEDDYVALLSKNPETLFQDESYMKHLRRNATKILLRTRQLHVIRWQMLEPFLEKIKKNVHYKDLGVDLQKCEDDPPALWWDDDCDKSLLVGIVKHGYEQYGLMRTDDALCFKKIAGPEKPVTRKSRSKGKSFTPAQSLSVVGEGSAPGTPMGSSFGGSGADEDYDIDEDSNIIDDDFDYKCEAMESMPERIPKIKRTPVQAAIPGMHIWPTVADLNTRARRLVTHFLKCQKQEEQRQAKLQRIKEKKEREKEVSRKKMLKRMEQAEKWSKREEQDFSRVISFYGVERNVETSEYDWSKFRQLANLARKPDDKITAYYLDFKSACRRVCNKLKPKRGSRTGHLLEPISEERAMRCLQRIDLLCAVREELLPHPRFDDLLSLCEPSFEVPQWWIPVQHDRDLLAGVAKHGLYRSEILIYGDPTLSFKETVPTSTLFTEPPVKEQGVCKERSDTKSESDESSLISPSGVVNGKASSVDINVLPGQEQSNQGEEVKKVCEHRIPDTINQSQELNREQCNHNQSTDQTQDCQHQDQLNSHTQSDQQPPDQNLMQTNQTQNLIQANQDQNEVVDQLHHSVKSTAEEVQVTSESQQTQCPSGQSSQQGEQTKEQGQVEPSSTTTVTTPSEPQTPNKIKAMCNAPIPIGWPKEKAIVMRINKIVFAFRNGVWPKPMEGLNMFQPLVQADGVPVDQSSSSEWSDSESMESPSASDTDLNSEPEQIITSRTSDSALPLEINQSGILSSKVKEIKAVSRTLAIEDRTSVGGLQKSPGIKLILKKVPAESSSDPLSLEIKIPLVKLNFSSVRGLKKIPKLSRKRTHEDRGDGVDEDYMPYSKKAHASFQRSPAVIQECYTAQEVIGGDSLPSYSFRNRSEKRSKESLWSKDKDWSPEADMESSDASED